MTDNAAAIDVDQQHTHRHPGASRDPVLLNATLNPIHSLLRNYLIATLFATISPRFIASTSQLFPMTIYDLHCHSTASDGLLAPAALVARAAKNGVEVLALTDHDSLDGLVEARQAAAEHQLSLVNGLEISVTWRERTLHIVGLDVALDHLALNEGLQTLQLKRQARAQEIGDKLARAGFPDALEEARRYGSDTNVTRTHFARVLLARGAVSTMQDAFNRYLKRGKPAYVKTSWVELSQAVEWINGASGRAVIAHPNRYDLTATKLRELLGEFVASGGRGLEVVYGGIDANVVGNNAAYARNFKLQASVGSDFHEPNTPWRELGRLPRLPKDLTPIWSEPWKTATPVVNAPSN